MAAFGAHHEWGKLREVVIGISPAEDFVVFHEASQRWLTPEGERFCQAHKGRRLLDVDPERAHRMERQVDALADLLARQGVVVHRPQRLQGEERTFMAPNGEGAQLFPRDAMIVVGDHVIDGSLRLACRQRERFGLRSLIQQMVQQRGARWSSVPFGSPACVDGPFLEGGDTLLNGREIYVGMSGCASDIAGIDWLQGVLGERYRVIPVAMKSNVLHLDCCLSLVGPRLLIWCPEKFVDGLPVSLRDWDKIAVSIDEANLLATNALVLEAGHVIVDADNSRVIDELRRRKIEVTPLPFDAPISTGGGLRCAHHPLLRDG